MRIRTRKARSRPPLNARNGQRYAFRDDFLNSSPKNWHTGDARPKVKSRSSLTNRCKVVDGTPVSFDIRYPLVRRLQKRFGRNSAAAMLEAVRSDDKVRAGTH
jgi:hypothetical protein